MIHDAARAHQGVTIYNRHTPFGDRVSAIDNDGRVLWSYDAKEGVSDIEITAGGNVLLAASLLGWKSQSEMDGIRIVNPNTDETLWSYEREVVHHDVDQLPNGDLLYLYRYAHGIRQADGIKILDPLTGLPKWVWRSSDHFHHSQRCDRCPTIDWTHANAVSYQEEGTSSYVYINLRNFNQICKIKVQTDNIVWCLGDGGSFGDGLFCHAHDPEILSNGNILVFDNGEHCGRETRVIEIAIDELRGNAEVVWEYRENPPFYSENRGDADQLSNGNILVTDAVNNRIFEVDYATKDVVWEYHIRGATTYKAQRIDSWPPRPDVD